MKLRSAVAGIALVAALSPAAASGVWRVVPSVSPQASRPTQSQLSAVSMAGVSAGWAVGNLVTTVSNPQGGPRLTVSQALAERWTGTGWRQVPMAQPATRHAFLGAVADLGPASAWAVGFTGDVAPGTSAPSGGLVEHWNGQHWSIVHTPGSSAFSLGAVAGTSPRDVWVAGMATPSLPAPPNGSTFFEHFNGTRWQQVPGPGGTFTAVPENVTGLAALSPASAWAVGTQAADADNLPAELNLAAHWNGKTWSVVPTPVLGDTVSQADAMTGITAVSATDVWASGFESVGCLATRAHDASPCLVPYVLHWDGQSWSLDKTPDPGAFGSTLDAISAVSAHDIWAVGQTLGSATGRPTTLTEHFNGTTWTVVPSPDPGTGGSGELLGVASGGRGQLAAVGGAAMPGDPCLTDVSGTFCLRTLALHTTSG